MVAGKINPLREELQSFTHSILFGQPPQVTALEGIRTLEVLENIHRLIP